MVNEPLLRQCVAAIENDPQSWWQSQWELRTECGTRYCLAGWAIHLTHPELRSVYDLQSDVFPYATNLLGLSELEGDILFGASAGCDEQCKKQILLDNHNQNDTDHLNRFKKLISRVTSVEFKIEEE